jgi:hypothetical protein
MNRKEDLIPGILKEWNQAWTHIDLLMPDKLKEKDPELDECIRNILGTQLLPNTPYGWFVSFYGDVNIFFQPSVPESGLILSKGEQIVEFNTDWEISVLRCFIRDILGLDTDEELRKVLAYLRDKTSFSLSGQPSEGEEYIFTITGDEEAIALTENELSSLYFACNNYFMWGTDHAQVHSSALDNLER